MKILSLSEKNYLAKAETKPLKAGYEGPMKPRPKVNTAESVFASNKVFTNWKMDDLVYSLELVTSPRFDTERDFHRGYRMYIQGQCMNCHTMFGRGGSFGPELTPAGNSFSAEDLLRAIIHPSDAINSRFQATTFKLKEGGIARGRLMTEDKDDYVIQLGYQPENVERVPKSNVVSQEPSEVSEMPIGLINAMSRNEVLDLLYFIIEVAGIEKDSLEIDIFEQKRIIEKGDSSLIDIVNYGNKGKIYYTLDGSEPTQNSTFYDGPFFIDESEYIRAMAFDGSLKGKEKSRSIHAVDRAVNGLNWQLYKNLDVRTFVKPKRKPDGEGVCYNFDVQGMVPEENKFAIFFDAYLEIEEAGAYTFAITKSHDEVKLFIDDKIVIDATKGKRWDFDAEQKVQLTKGKHKFSIVYYDELSSEYLEVKYKGPNITLQEIPMDKFFLK